MGSQSVHGPAGGVVAAAASGFDGWEEVNGRKRHLLAGTLGLLIAVVVGPASGQGRDGAAALLLRARRRGRHRLALAWADNACHGEYQQWPRRELGITAEIAGRQALAAARERDRSRVLPRRWAAERANAWISRRRRRARDYERLPEHHAAMVQIAAIIQMTRRAATP
jgi:transposase